MGAQFSSVFQRSPSNPETLTAAASSSLTGSHEIDKYEVFISFRGSDVRRGFVSHLFPALTSKQIHAFMDNDLERGKDITAYLFQIIEQSDLSIVIFSQNYPKSEWCMQELEKIHDTMKQRKQRVLPVFYEVDPSHVQDLKGNYAIKDRKWRDALADISNLSGFDSKSYSTDAELIDNIVETVSTILCEIFPRISHYEGLFGIESSVKDVEALLQFDSKKEVRMVGIWGMGGIGKTTIASKVFDRNKKKFHGHCLVSNVREKLSTEDGLRSLRDIVIRELLQDKNIKADLSLSLDESIRRRIKRVEVLLVLDDVLTCMQLKSLLETIGLYSPDSLCPGSRIIVTSRDSQVLRDVKLKSDIYEAKELRDIEALHLLCWHAFGQTNPQQGYEELSEKVVQYSHGVPLALVVLGSELKHKAINYWEGALKKFNMISPFEIQKILRISFDVLDRDEKNIFLDIACFLKGNTRDQTINVLESFGFHASVGIGRLIDKSLLKEEVEYSVIAEEKVIITMHDLLEQMGKEIVVEEKETKGYQSRLWTSDDTIDALTNNMENKNVEAISLQHWHPEAFMEIHPEAFVHMRKLRFLKFRSDYFQRVICPMGLEFLPNSITYLQWDNFSQSYWPSNYYSNKLVELQLPSSELTELVWSKPLVSLKIICLSGSSNLIKISDWEMTPSLEIIDLSFCDRLVEVGSSLKNLKKLSRLNVRACSSLSHLPELPCSITEIDFRESGLRKLPEKFGHLTHLKQLSLTMCDELEVIPSSISNLVLLEVLDLQFCGSLVEIGSSLENLKNLTLLNVSDCQSLSSLPDIPSSIMELQLAGSGLKQLPTTIGRLTHLKELKLFHCLNLESLPSSFCNLTSLETLNLKKCKNLRKLPEDFGNLVSLKVLNASYSGLTELPPSIQCMKELSKLELTSCMELKFLPALPSNLQSFEARHCASLDNKAKSSIVEQYRRKVHDQPTKMHAFCVDAKQVPKWMKYRNSGSSISLELNTVGHPMSVIFGLVILSNLTGHEVISITPAVFFNDQNSEACKSFCYPDASSRKKTSHLFLWNVNIDRIRIQKVSYGLMADSKKGTIIKCGFHPIFSKKNYRQTTHSEDEEHPNYEYNLRSLFME